MKYYIFTEKYFSINEELHTPTPQNPQAYPLLCPICRKTLTNQHEGLSTCPDGHGTLVAGKYLSNIEQSPELDEVQSANAVDSVYQVMCPHCSAVIHKVDYNGTGIIIDTCTKCPYRWLDSGEASKIKNCQSDIAPQDLLFIAI